MPKRVIPRWGDNGAHEIPELSPEQVLAINALAEAVHPKDAAAAAAELTEIAQTYLVWLEQDEKGPTRAERNAALKEILDATKRLERLLSLLDGASESDLVDVLAPLRVTTRAFDAEGNVTSAHNSQEYGFHQLESLRSRLAHLNDTAGRTLRRQSRKPRRGPTAKKTLPEIVSRLCEFYERRTGKRVSHTAVKNDQYLSSSQSDAGKFITHFMKVIDTKLRTTAVSSTLAQVIKRRRLQNRKVSSR